MVYFAFFSKKCRKTHVIADKANVSLTNFPKNFSHFLESSVMLPDTFPTNSQIFPMPVSHFRGFSCVRGIFCVFSQKVSQDPCNCKNIKCPTNKFQRKRCFRTKSSCACQPPMPQHPDSTCMCKTR